MHVQQMHKHYFIVYILLHVSTRLSCHQENQIQMFLPLYLVFPDDGSAKPKHVRSNIIYIYVMTVSALIWTCITTHNIAVLYI